MVAHLYTGFMRVLRPVLVLAFMAVFVAGCNTIVRNHGYAPSEAELDALVIGQDTRETVVEKVGRPITTGLSDARAWYYVQGRWEQKGFAAPKEIARQVVVLTFAANDVLQNVERFGLEAGKVVTLSRRVTVGSVPEDGILMQLFSNFGRLRPGQIVDEN